MNPDRPADTLKVLVVIASFGEKNLACLRQVIRTYRDMGMNVDLVVTAEAPKSVDLGVRVIVGTPTRNPRSLPFAHKKLFADNVDRYDLYIYTEDDIHVREESIRAFVRVNSRLASDEIVGFTRYEVAPDGTRFVPDVHGAFHWRPGSVRRRGEYLIAEFTNEHSGFYVLTNAQLRRALASGSFVQPPFQGRYEMLESAATDIYVNYGFRKVLCISHLEDFLIHHMPNRYVGQMGIPLALFKEQIQILTEIQAGVRPTAVLCEVEPKVLQIRCAKAYDETPSIELLRAVPPDAKTILSIGCGSGATEKALQGRGAKVTTFPLDSVVGVTAARQGIEVIQGSLDECFHAIGDRRFDCVLMTNLIHLLPEPEMVLERCAELVDQAGSVVIEGRNFDHLPSLIKRTVGCGDYRLTRRFSESGIHLFGPRGVSRIMRRVGFNVGALAWRDHGWPWPLGKLARGSGRFGARTWILRLQRRPSAQFAKMPQASSAIRAELMNNAVPVVSVGLPVFNGGTFLRRSIRSILDQDYQALELIISDNGSSDDTESICREAAARDSRVRYYRNAVNVGAARNYNKVFELARGKYFKWAAHDDECHPAMVRRCVDVLDRSAKGVVMVYPLAELIDEEGNPITPVLDTITPVLDRIASSDPRPHRRLGHLLWSLNMCDPVFGVYKTEYLRKTQLIGPWFGADYVMLGELAMMGEIVELDEVLFRLRAHPHRSVQANRSTRENTAWYDPSVANRLVVLPSWEQMVWALFRSACRARLPLTEKVTCCLAILAVHYWRRFKAAGGRTKRRIKASLVRLNVRHLLRVGHP